MDKITIKLPFIYEATDYHEFSALQDTLKKLSGKVVKYKELDFDGYYKAIFYNGQIAEAKKKLGIKSPYRGKHPKFTIGD